MLFAHLLAKPGHKTFHLLLQNLDQFLNKSKYNILLVSHPILTFNIFPLHYILNSHFTKNKNCQRKNLFKMMQALFFTTNTIIKEFEKYHRCKIINPTTLLPKKYHKFLNIFLKKETNTLSIYRLYDHTMNIKDNYQLFLVIIYRISRDEI